MFGLLLAFACAACASDISPTNLLLCVVTARRDQSYLQALVTGLQDENANFLVVDVDNSTAGATINYTPSIGALTLEGPPQPCIPGPVPCPMQRQGVDIVRGLQRCAEEEPTSKYVGIIEDDMTVCKGSIQTIMQELQELRDFKTARFAKFSRATILPRKNIALYANYVMRNIHKTPHDILLNFDWAKGEDYIHPTSLFARRQGVHHQGEKRPGICRHLQHIAR